MNLRSPGSLVFVVALLLAACGDPNTASTAPTSPAEFVVPTTSTSTPPVLTGRLRVTQNQTSCCYTEGQVSFLDVVGPDGSQVDRRRFQMFGSIMPVTDLQLAPGPYEISSYQQPCDGNCDILDAATNQCRVHVDIAESTAYFLTVAFATDDQTCTFTHTDTPLESPVPDEFALRSPYKDCGFDVSLQVPGGRSGLERDCFAEANSDGTEAELTAFEAGAIAETPDFFVYRTNADRTIQVFRPNLDRVTDGPWRMYTCAGLEPDEVLGFALTGCTDPVEIQPTGGP